MSSGRLRALALDVDAIKDVLKRVRAQLPYPEEAWAIWYLNTIDNLIAEVENLRRTNAGLVADYARLIEELRRHASGVEG
jgi:hypothetical protein